MAKKYAGGSWRWYFFDGLKTIAEGTGTSDKMFYTLAPGAIGGIICRDNNGTKYWYHTDRLGNVMAVTDSNGAAYAVYTMDAWGNVLEKGLGNGYSSEHATDPQPYHLTTKEYDPDSQLHYFFSRWYDHGTGRFISRARSRPDQEHPFALARGNPVGCADPRGEFAACLLFVAPCMDRIARDVDARYNGSPPHDRFKHCLVGSRTRRECCVLWPTPLGLGCGACIQWLGLLHELITPWDPSDSPGDMRANADGITCHWQFWKSCEACCKDKGYCPKKK